MKLSIICLNYREREKTLRQCLQAILDSKLLFPYEVLLIDNASGDTIAKNLASEFEKTLPIRFFQNKENLGFGRGNEVGISASSGEYLFILNPDVVVTPSAIAALVSRLDEQLDVGIIGPQLRYLDGKVQDSYRRFPSFFDLIIKRTRLQRYFGKQMREYLMWEKNPESAETVDWLVAAALMVRRSVLREVGGFARNYFLFFDDTDLCRRAWNAGWKVLYFPQAKAIHHHERLSEGSFRTIFTKKTVRIHLLDAVRYFWNWKKFSPFEKGES